MKRQTSRLFGGIGWLLTACMIIHDAPVNAEAQPVGKGAPPAVGVVPMPVPGGIGGGLRGVGDAIRQGAVLPQQPMPQGNIMPPLLPGPQLGALLQRLNLGFGKGQGKGKGKGGMLGKGKGGLGFPAGNMAKGKGKMDGKQGGIMPRRGGHAGGIVGGRVGMGGQGGPRIQPFPPVLQPNPGLPNLRPPGAPIPPQPKKGAIQPPMNLPNLPPLPGGKRPE